MHKELSTGYPVLGDALLLLANSLKPYSATILSDLKIDISDKSQLKSNTKNVKTVKKQLPSQVENLNAEEVINILNDPAFSKLQIIEVGTIRFGISKSKLIRLNRNAVSESVLAALNHERSLSAISEGAQRSGNQRSS